MKLNNLYITALTLMAASVAAGCASPFVASSSDFAAKTDSRTYKVPFPGPGDLESWFVSLELRRPEPDSRLVSLRATLLRDGAVLKDIVYASDVVEGLVAESQRAKEEFYIDLLFHEPASLQTEQVSVQYEFSSGNSRHKGEKLIEVGAYEQKNEFIFPLTEKSLITAGYFNSGGHLSPATLFAVDAIGVTSSYSPVTGLEEEENTSMAGWGREIVAPADGKVVFVQTGVRDQPYGTYNRESYLMEDGSYAHWGNAVMIDHGDSEFGIVMHMQQGSVAVAVGDEVRQGQKLGTLGNSGDSYGPHLHFHLQSESVPLRGRGLPVTFSDVSLRFLRKGEWIDRD